MSDLPDEIWKEIKGLEGRYEISNKGRVKSLPRQENAKLGSKFGVKGCILKQTLRHGYCHVGIIKNGKRTHHRVHRLVAAAFIENKNNKPCVNHINSVKTDNRVENLEWCTNKENSKHYQDFIKNDPTYVKKPISDETRKKIGDSNRGKKRSAEERKKMSDRVLVSSKNKKPVIAKYEDGKEVEFPSISSASLTTGTALQTIYDSINSKQKKWKHKIRWRLK